MSTASGADSYNSALAKRPSVKLSPPATSTCPSGSNVAVCRKRGVAMLPVAVHIPVAGSYSSPLVPRHGRFCSHVRVSLTPAMVMLPVSAPTPVAASYTAPAKQPSLMLSPPATSTCPFGSNVAVWSQRALRRLPVSLHVLVVGSYSSEGPQRPVEPAPLQAAPPATNTSPFGSNLAVYSPYE